MMLGKLSLKRRFFCKIAEFWLFSLRISPKNLEFGRGAGILALWHRDLFAATAAFRGKGLAAFVSPSDDGEFLAKIASDLGYRIVRGSSSAKSMEIRQMLKWLKSGVPCAMALDGPRGPVLVEKPGTRWLSEKAGVPIWMLEIRYSASIRLSTWDFARIPLPFSKVFVQIREYAGNSAGCQN